MNSTILHVVFYSLSQYDVTKMLRLFQAMMIFNVLLNAGLTIDPPPPVWLWKIIYFWSFKKRGGKPNLLKIPKGIECSLSEVENQSKNPFNRLTRKLSLR